MTFSASRISTWMACNRKAGWTYFMGYEAPPTASTELGSAVHAHLEAFARHGTPIDRTEKAGIIASEGAAYVAELLRQHAPVRPVTEGELAVQGKHLWTGRKDLSFPGSVIDYKTTSDFKWAKTPEDLRYDPQAMLYAEHEFRAVEGAGASLDHVSLTWLYLLTRSTRTSSYQIKPVQFSIDRPHAAAGFRALESYADEMQEAACKAPQDIVARHHFVLTLAPNYDHCDAFGGCPHQSRCNVSFFRQKKEGPMSNPMSLLDRLMAQNALNGGAANEANNAAFTTLPTPGGNPHPMATRTDIPALGFTGTFVTPAVNIAPPSPAAAALPEPPMEAPAINPPRRGPGRPRKNADAAPAPAPASAPPAPAPAPPAAVTPAATAEPFDHSDFSGVTTLFVGCLPRSGWTTADFDEIVSRAKSMIGPQDYRLYEYGKGNGLLLDAVTAVVKNSKPSAIVVADPRTPEAVLCLSFLRSVSTTVVEALR